MKIVLTLLVRDEDDLIRQNVEYHLDRDVDHVVATDNLSRDRTRDILLDFERRGVLRYLHEPGDDYSQARWVTRMARLAQEELGADWVINGDADEFWWVEGGGSLKSALAEVPARVRALRVPRLDFPARPRRGRGFLEAMVYREREATNALGRPLQPKVCHRALPGLAIGQGNHRVFSLDREVRAAPTSALSIFHFPIRSYRRFRNKVRNGGAAYSRSSLPPEVGDAWRYLHRLERQGRLRSFYESRFLDDRRLRLGLRDGSLVEDRRLLEYFRRRNLQAVDRPLIDARSPRARPVSPEPTDERPW